MTTYRNVPTMLLRFNFYDWSNGDSRDHETYKAAHKRFKAARARYRNIKAVTVEYHREVLKA